MGPISIETNLEEFNEHLKMNQRTIFSARFGDGKSYFLNKFRQTYQREYEFITLYPVNYQIADNKEIFEYIKRDILIQMIVKGMVRTNPDISDSLMLQFYIMNNSQSLLENLIKSFPLLGLPETMVSTFINGYKGIVSTLNFKNSFSKYKKAIINKDDQAIIESFVKDFSNEAGSPYEMDLITYLIYNNIHLYAKENNKKIVLILEDLDRLDPAHFFRILNIFSAHIDRVYQLGTIESENKEDFPELNNKFGFDNIITVFDNVIAQKTFKHFYGKDANYDGYICKFLTTIPFHYSINSIARAQLHLMIREECYVDLACLSGSQALFSELSVRDVEKIFENYQKRIKNGYLSIRHDSNLGDNIHIKTYGPLTKFISILLLVKADISLVKNFFVGLPITIELMNCLGTFALLDKKINNHDIYNINGDIYMFRFTSFETKEQSVYVNDCEFEKQSYRYGSIHRMSEDILSLCFDGAVHNLIL